MNFTTFCYLFFQILIFFGRLFFYLRHLLTPTPTTYDLYPLPTTHDIQLHSTKKCIMPFSRERRKGIIGRGHDLRLVGERLFNIVRILQTTALKSQKFLHESSYDGFSGTDNGEQSLNNSASVFHLWLLEAFS